MRILPALAAAMVLCVPALAEAEPPTLRLGIEVHGSFLTNQVDRSLLNVTFGGAVRIGYRADGATWGGYVVFEQNAWLATELARQVVPGVRNFGIGVERIWADGIVRTSLSVGLSTLAFDTELHQKNTTGIFFDLRPAALRWAITDAVAFELTPFHLAVVAPVLDEPTLVNVEYRTTLGFEFGLR
ncbi:MAG: hypothetical protein AAF938_23300 [Myxococcota bacterium]